MAQSTPPKPTGEPNRRDVPQDEARDDVDFASWLASLPADDWSGALDLNAFRRVRWIDGVGFVETGEGASEE
jgi:hypothetical protein